MPSLQRSKFGLVLVVAAAMLSGCGAADYMNNWDSSSVRTGDAMMANTAIQQLEAWPPTAYKTTVGSGG